jgi:hypothetical protein
MAAYSKAAKETKAPEMNTEDKYYINQQTTTAYNGGTQRSQIKEHIGKRQRSNANHGEQHAPASFWNKHMWQGARTTKHMLATKKIKDNFRKRQLSMPM